MFKKMALFLTSLFLVGSMAIALSYTQTERTSADLLGKLGIIVDKSANPSEYRLDDNVLRQEMAGITTSLGCVSKNSTCRGDFEDVSATKPNNWVCYSAEALLDAGAIAGNTHFRPEDNISKTEAVGMVVKALYGNEYAYDNSLNTTWQQQVVAFAVAKGLVNNFTDYDALATRGFIFEVASKAIAKSGAKCSLWNTVDTSTDPNPTSSYNNNTNTNTNTNNTNNNTNNTTKTDDGKTTTTTCPDGYQLSGGSCYKITESSNNTSTAGKCESTTISGYTVPALSSGSQVEVQKTVSIMLGTRVQTQKFECKGGTFAKVGDEVIGKATCQEGENQDPADPTLCYYNPSGGGGTKAATPSCVAYTSGNGTFLDTGVNAPTNANTAWQTTNSSGACYVECDTSSDTYVWNGKDECVLEEKELPCGDSNGSFSSTSAGFINNSVVNTSTGYSVTWSGTINDYAPTDSTANINWTYDATTGGGLILVCLNVMLLLVMVLMIMLLIQIVINVW